MPYTYKLDHRTFSFRANFGATVQHLEAPYVIQRLDLSQMRARLETEPGNHIIVPLTQTPHYEFLLGREGAYRKYLADHSQPEHSPEAFRAMLQIPACYLGEGHESDYIICDSDNVILDGVHRACALLQAGATSLPVAVLRPANQLLQYIADYRDDWLEWYTPIQLPDLNVFINERTYPDFVERPEFHSNRERGRSRWDFIVGSSLPDVKGKSICDVGCNVGLFSVYLWAMGASRVVGFDRVVGVQQPSNRALPSQDVIQQAYFVKNLFRLQQFDPNVDFVGCDLATVDFTRGWNYDVFFSCCVLYHFGERFREIIHDVASQVPVIFLETNLGHGGELGKYASVEYHVGLLEENGFRSTVVAPAGYNYPVIIGRK